MLFESILAEGPFPVKRVASGGNHVDKRLDAGSDLGQGLRVRAALLEQFVGNVD